MKLILKRIAKRKNYTIGRLYIRTEEVEEFRTYTKDEYICDTLEPPCIEMKVDRTVIESQTLSSYHLSLRVLHISSE